MGDMTDDTQVVILLCAVLGRDQESKPLTPSEYNVVARWLKQMEMRPEDLLKGKNTGLAAAGAGISEERLKNLLERGVQLGFAFERWEQNGIWILSRSDEDYPVRYKKHLKSKAPPLLFGIGNRSLLKGGGVAIVGSRNVDRDGELFTMRAAERIVSENMPVISGGARGVDRIAMGAALEAGGVTTGVLTDGLLKKSLEREARSAIHDNRLVLVSPYHPEAPFTVGSAMGRNKLIYALADYGLVISSDYKKGGTWAGAQEELKRECPRPVFVRMGENIPLGNKKLLELGALPWPELADGDVLTDQLKSLGEKSAVNSKPKTRSLFDYQQVDGVTVFEPGIEYKSETVPERSEKVIGAFPKEEESDS